MTEFDLVRWPKMSEDYKHYHMSLTKIQDCKHYLQMSLTESTFLCLQYSEAFLSSFITVYSTKKYE